MQPSIGVFKGLNKEERDIIGAAGLNQTTNALREQILLEVYMSKSFNIDDLIRSYDSDEKEQR